MRSWEKLRHGWYRTTIEKSVVKEPLWRARLNDRYFAWAMSRRIACPITSRLLYEKPEQSPLTQRYWENTHPDSPLTAPVGVVPWVVELCRVEIPLASVGVCKSFEQFVYHPDLQDPSWFSTSSSWGNPFPLPATVRIVWHFRLERAGTAEPPWINASSATPAALLPGVAHFDVPEMRDLWFPAASSSSQNFHLTVGSRYRLRVVAIVERDAEYALEIAAKIRGFELSSFDATSLLAIRAIW